MLWETKYPHPIRVRVRIVTHESKQAEQLLAELDALTDRTRASERSVVTGLPLVGWGTAWTAGYPALGLLDGVARISVAVLAWLVAMALSWFPLRASVRTGVEGRMRWAWLVVLAASPFLVAAARPESWTAVGLLLGGLWSLAMCLWAVATRDLPFAIAAFFGTIAAAASASQETVQPLALFGLLAGPPLLGVGIVRVIVGARRG